MDNNKRSAYLSMETLDSVDYDIIASIDTPVVSQLLRYIVRTGREAEVSNL